MVEGLRASDPKRLAIYFSKHGAAQSDSPSSGKEYQHLVPEAWTGAGNSPGRFSGYWGLKRVACSVTLSCEDLVRARRILRRWSRSRASYRPGERYPISVTPSTVVRRVPLGGGYRRSRGRRHLCASGALVEGFACVTSGPNFSVQLSRAIATWAAADSRALFSNHIHSEAHLDVRLAEGSYESLTLCDPLRVDRVPRAIPLASYSSQVPDRPVSSV